eukprot:SAG11_NODE_9281_length_926_cov_1.384522_1_plen_31_part_10
MELKASVDALLDDCVSKGDLAGAIEAQVRGL